MGDDVRAIALAIVLAGAGIEFAILKAAGRDGDYAVAMGTVSLMLICALIYCLVVGV
jgi:hypothetical protein